MISSHYIYKWQWCRGDLLRRSPCRASVLPQSQVSLCPRNRSLEVEPWLAGDRRIQAIHRSASLDPGEWEHRGVDLLVFESAPSPTGRARFLRISEPHQQICAD